MNFIVYKLHHNLTKTFKTETRLRFFYDETLYRRVELSDP